jgi:hypothetical protein
MGSTVYYVWLKLNVESPYPIPSREVLQLKPDVLGYPQNFPKYRYYGNNIKYIDVANKWDEGDMKTHSLKWLQIIWKVLFKLEQRHR